MTFSNAIATCFSKYATFEGVAARSEYWWFVLFTFLAYLVSALISPTLYLIVVLVLFLPTLAVTVRRLHDTDRSGWWILISLIPLVGLILLVWMCMGTDANSRWATQAAAAS